ncbi:MAG TPA: hypothetical protein VGQ89_08515 [Candidatus Limnocylindrales bacterium]|jgi:hypothetical protein|nr:hypothetical protein [Candidatus Limnocylindrales bacterium]
MNYEERQRRLDRVRLAIWAELLIGLLATLLTGFLFIAAPGFMGLYEPSFVAKLIPAVAPVLSFVAWLWMVRLSRPRLEAGEATWRYRAWRD